MPRASKKDAIVALTASLKKGEVHTIPLYSDGGAVTCGPHTLATLSGHSSMYVYPKYPKSWKWLTEFVGTPLAVAETVVGYCGIGNVMKVLRAKGMPNG